VISSRDQDRLTDAATEIRDETGCESDAVETVVCDLAQPDSVERAAREAIDHLGGLDVLVTNHGGPETTPFPSLSLADFDDAYTAILRSAILTCQVALPALEDGGGAITNLVAASSLEPGSRGVLGNVFRPGLYGLSKTLSEEVGDRDIRVNCVSPRGIVTDRIQEKLEARAEREGIDVEQARAQRIADLPLTTLGTPQSFARAVVFVSSPAADFVTGSVLPVDGGWHRHAF
jgi:3-oxoacyl-[acyl-carrier protein] reductase